MITRSLDARSSASNRFTCSAVIADGCSTGAVRLGANRSISADQLASNDAGATSRLGLVSLRAFACTSSRARIWIVLPSPMSSARQAPRPRPDSNRSHATPAF